MVRWGWGSSEGRIGPLGLGQQWQKGEIGFVSIVVGYAS